MFNISQIKQPVIRSPLKLQPLKAYGGTPAGLTPPAPLPDTGPSQRPAPPAQGRGATEAPAGPARPVQPVPGPEERILGTRT